jgi:hypothetical protein
VQGGDASSARYSTQAHRPGLHASSVSDPLIVYPSTRISSIGRPTGEHIIRQSRLPSPFAGNLRTLHSSSAPLGVVRAVYVEEVPVFLVLSVFGGAAVGSEEEFELSVGIVTPAETADPSTALGMTIRYHLQLLHDHHIRVISSGASACGRDAEPRDLVVPAHKKTQGPSITNSPPLHVFAQDFG